MKPLEIAHEHPKTKRTVRQEAEFLAHEIQHDVMAPEAEIADAIEVAIVRYARALYLTPHQNEARRQEGGPALLRLESGAVVAPRDAKENT